MKTLIALAALVLTLSISNHVVASSENMPPPQTTPQFETLKGLAGTWVGEGTMHGKTEKIKVNYKVSSGENIVMETFNPGTPSEMLSVYYLDGKDLRMTHYCSLGNQPRMKMTESKKTKEGEVISLKMVEATGMESPQEPHMGALSLIISGKDKLAHQWTYVGPKGEETSLFEFEKKK